MDILIILIPLAIGLALFFVGLFIWAASKGQYDDLETPAQRILYEENHSGHKKYQGDHRHE